MCFKKGLGKWFGGTSGIGHRRVAGANGVAGNGGVRELGSLPVTRPPDSLFDVGLGTNGTLPARRIVHRPGGLRTPDRAPARETAPGAF